MIKLNTHAFGSTCHPSTATGRSHQTGTAHPTGDGPRLDSVPSDTTHTVACRSSSTKLEINNILDQY